MKAVVPSGDAEVFAEWLRAQGHKTIKTASSWWCLQGLGAYQAFPYHWLISPPEEELRELLRSHRGTTLRYSTDLSAAEGFLSYHAVYERPSYGFDDLSKWARKNVQRGLRSCVVEPVSFERLAREGFELQLDTLDRQGRKLRLEQDEWSARCKVAGELPGFEAWGALVGGRLAASVITFRMGDCAYMLYQQSHREFLATHATNALSFTVTTTLLARPAIRSILYGLHSLDAPPSVDEFKFRMGYSAKPVRQRVVFHPWLTPFVNSASHGALRFLRSLSPSQPALAKAEGMVRFFREGRWPLAEQAFTAGLPDSKAGNASTRHTERSQRSLDSH